MTRSPSTHRPHSLEPILAHHLRQLLLGVVTDQQHHTAAHVAPRCQTAVAREEQAALLGHKGGDGVGMGVGNAWWVWAGMAALLSAVLQHQKSEAPWCCWASTYMPLTVYAGRATTCSGQHHCMLHVRLRRV